LGLAGAGQEEADPLTGAAGELAGVDTCGETTTVTKGAMFQRGRKSGKRLRRTRTSP
jgi:hypothetical protein